MLAKKTCWVVFTSPSFCAVRLLTEVMQCLSFKKLFCIHNYIAGFIPCGKFSADIVVLQTDARVTLLKQGQHLPCGALLSSYQLGTERKEYRSVFVCVCAPQIKVTHCKEGLLTWLFCICSENTPLL